MKITIVGGGNIGTQFAVHFSEKGHEVSVYTSAPELFQRQLNIVDSYGNTTHEGIIKQATADPIEAFGEAEVIIITLPATMMDEIAKTIYTNADGKAIIGVVPGNGGGECAFRSCVKRGNPFFGIERVPAIARLVQKGKTVKSTGYREELHIATIPGRYANGISELISSIFDTQCQIIPSFLNLTMTPSNPIIHTTRLRTIFQNWEPGVVYERLPLFYEEWDNESSELMIACDDEVQQICQALPEFKLEYVKSLKKHYESYTALEMTRKISSISAFKGLPTPSVQVEGGYIPDLHSRYFTADFSFGLTIIKQIADFAGVNTPNIDATLAWYRNIALESKEFHFSDYSITNRESLGEYYLQ